MAASHGIRPLWQRALAVLAGILLLAAPTLYVVPAWVDGTLDVNTLAAEWGMIENVHAALTAVSAWLFFLAWRNGKGPVRVAGGALAMLAAAAFVRELDVKKLSAATGPDWLYFLADHGLQEALLIAMCLPILIYLYRERRHLWGCIQLGLRWQAWALYLSGALVLLCVYLDERVVHDVRMRFWEELIETYSYVFMVLAAWLHLRLADDAAWSREA